MIRRGARRFKRWVSAITGRFVSAAYGKAHDDTETYERTFEIDEEVEIERAVGVGA